MKKEKSLLALAIIACLLTACGDADTQQSQTVADQEYSDDAYEEQTETEDVDEDAEDDSLDDDLEDDDWDDEDLEDDDLDEEEDDGSFLLEGLDLQPEELREIYEEFEAAFDSADESDPDYEDKITEQIAKKHNITEDQAGNVYIYVSTYGMPKAKSYYDLEYGRFVEASNYKESLIIKAKIEPSFSNKATIEQNYYNVCDIIREQGGDELKEIQYWAVADMTNGEESKVISFTVPEDVIETIANSEFPDNTLGDYVEDLYVHPSLLN